MGVPAFFRWLSKKFPAIVVQCDEAAQKNESEKYHFDNLYLDMNGIIHPCSHPEYKAPPETEEEMFDAIFEYVERILKIVRPKKLLYMAVDGVAPRAKMNQQRSRRFRASQESYDKIVEINKIKAQLREQGVEVKEKPKEEHFDSNVITPGTQFMINLSDALRNWIEAKLSLDYQDSDGVWPKDLMVILSDASVPGEGEHKIVDFIRKQKAQSSVYNPNLSHCLYGADADLIMLGLATHELNFTIIREEFKPNQPKPCDICGQLGHEMKDCQGSARNEDDVDVILPTEPDFIFIRLNVLREYLKKLCDWMDLERFVDDFVFLCFFVGNDFLPHLPSLEIREGAIDRLLGIYKEVMNSERCAEPYLTKDGFVKLDRVQTILQYLGQVEDEIFQRRQQNTLRFKERNKRQKQQQKMESAWLEMEAVKAGEKPKQLSNVRLEAYNLRTAADSDNLSAAQKLKAMLRNDNQLTESESNISRKRKYESDSDSEDEPEDLIQLWEDGWKERYYYHKFDCSGISDISQSVAREYIKGLCWVLQYYYQGCPDWKWFYPYHYAPFASDFIDITKMEVNFDRKARPFHPLEQLMSVFPAASSKNLPPSWRQLMSEADSPIIDFYPTAFKIDLNGKRAAWQGVALLPFIDELRLFEALEKVYPNLTEEETNRNARGTHLLFVSKVNSEFATFFKNIVESDLLDEFAINTESVKNVMGLVKKHLVFSPKYKNVSCLMFKDPVYDSTFVFPAIRLPKAKIPPTVLKPEDFDSNSNRTWKPMIGMTHSQKTASLSNAGMRMLNQSFDYQGNSQTRNTRPFYRENQPQTRYSSPNYTNSPNPNNYSASYAPANQINFYRESAQHQPYRPFYNPYPGIQDIPSYSTVDNTSDNIRSQQPQAFDRNQRN